MPTLSRNAQCILKILEVGNSLTTSEILDLTRNPEYADICKDCAGGDIFVVAANQLVEQGLVTRKIGKGGYRWQMVRD
jgi:hypothetical protein